MATKYWGAYFGDVEYGTEDAPFEFEYTVTGRCAERVPMQSQLYGHIRVACGRALPCERHSRAAATQEGEQ